MFFTEECLIKCIVRNRPKRRIGWQFIFLQKRLDRIKRLDYSMYRNDMSILDILIHDMSCVNISGKNISARTGGRKWTRRYTKNIFQ